MPTWYGVAYFILVVQTFSMSFFRPQPPYHAVGLSLIVFGLLAMIQSNANLRKLGLKVESPQPSVEGARSYIFVELNANLMTQ